MEPNPDPCEACSLEWKGWGGAGCCEVCDTITADHTCLEAQREREFLPLVKKYAEDQYSQFQSAIEEVQRGIMTTDEARKMI